MAVMETDQSDRRSGTEVELAPVLATSYATLIDAELQRRLPKAGVPLAAHAADEAPARICAGGALGGATWLQE